MQRYGLVMARIAPAIREDAFFDAITRDWTRRRKGRVCLCIEGQVQESRAWRRGISQVQKVMPPFWVEGVVHQVQSPKARFQLV